MFPPETKVDASNDPTITLPAKIKERSLSSLVVETPKIATQTSLTGRRTKAARRTTASHMTSLINNGTMKLLNNSEGRDQKTKKTSAPESTKMATSANKKQVLLKKCQICAYQRIVLCASLMPCNVCLF